MDFRPVNTKEIAKKFDGGFRELFVMGGTDHSIFVKPDGHTDYHSVRVSELKNPGARNEDAGRARRDAKRGGI